ncbi:MAG TPA: GNAT family N-acetyltransferase [Actinomycetota bacterium]|nr:GNAT family N-acetyltransferase [Actinomycetota bacterium]
MDVRPLRPADRERARAWLREHLAESMAANGELFYPAEHDGFIAGDWDGLITYRIGGGRCEVTLLKALHEGQGVGSALLAATVSAARDAGCVDVWLVSTNDNLHALEWYDRKGFAVTEIRDGAVDRSRETLKPSIPTHNPDNGLPIRDEIELSLAL